jgi:predicted site-specific integrase-resolvase
MYKVGEFSKLIKKSVKTLQRWDRENVFKPEIRTPTNRRLYSHKQYLDYFNFGDNLKRRNVIYCRVSSSGQKSDLKTQKEFLNQFTFNNGLSVDDIYEDVGSGLNYRRKNFLRLTKEIIGGEINVIIIAHKDRLVRFGFEWFEWLCNEYNTKILIINDDKLSPEKEMCNDLMSIIHVFSSRLYGLRKYKKEINETCKENIN